MSQTTRPAQQGRSGRQGDKPRRPRREPVVIPWIPKTILGKSILAVVNLPPRQIGSFMSEVLVLGLEDENQSIVLIAPEANVPNGSKLK